MMDNDRYQQLRQLIRDTDVDDLTIIGETIYIGDDDEQYSVVEIFTVAKREIAAYDRLRRDSES